MKSNTAIGTAGSHATAAEALRVRATAELVRTQAAIEVAIEQMARQISAVLGASNPVVLPVMLGGLFTAVRLCMRFDFAYELDRIQVGRYGDNFAGGDLRWIVEPGIDLSGRIVLIVDDILDKGVTLAGVRQHLLERGAQRVFAAVLVIKEVDRSVSVHVDFEGIHCADRYVFGCGMDYRGYWRGLPALYALPDPDQI